ncbi:MAG TPA: DNA polymerase III subunit alpha [Candidatus Saccharimonadaceae bacterium]|jgi:DNA-directed DNA polymerase III PolC|nr:DNA polymerase III subunit alpha [Candidatus Saccharimonadaceae bacterium]
MTHTLAPAFVPLRVRSHGSLLEGTASPEQLVRTALERGAHALALTDRNNLYLAIRFWQAAHAEGLVPLPGAELVTADAAALLLPLDRRGWARLCALLTARHLDPAFDLIAALGEGAAGLHVIVETPALAASLLAAGVPAARATGAGASGGLWLGVRGLSFERPRLAERLDAARALGVPAVATGDCVMLNPLDHDAHAIAMTAARGELLERMPPGAFATRDAWLASPAEWTRRVRALCTGAGRPEAAAVLLAHNVELAARCRLELELGTPIFPRHPEVQGAEGLARLQRLCDDGVRWRYGGGRATAGAHGPAAYAAPAPPASPGARATTVRAAGARLAEELSMIARMGFTDYFLLVAEIVGFARARGIPTVGRGSGAGSIVAYVLGITNVDPLRYNLYFERFLNPSRRDCPDLDIDLCWKRRDEVIAHVYDAYGHDRVAMISTHATLGARSAFRETAKALGVPNARVNVLAKRVPRDLEAPYAPKLAAFAGGRDVDWREPVLARALALAEKLSGAPRHLSVHAGGLVIADRPLTHYVPLERAAKNVVVTQFEMRAIEAIGLVKMDLLGNRALTEIGDCASLVTRRGGPVIDVDAIPDDDPATAARVGAGATLNCFQLESPAMRHLLRMIAARNLDDTIAAVALVRPGPAGSPGGEGRDRNTKETFCRRQRGLEPSVFAHPRLEPVLRETHGLMLYEEDVMRVAAALTPLTLAEGDDLRRAIAHARDDEEFRALERGFVTQARREGVDDASAHAVWRELTRFAAYAFCRAHAAGYGRLGWQAAYLKTHFPAEYAVSILNHHAGMYPTWVHVEDLRRQGACFLPPCAARSTWDSAYEAGAVRVGLGRVLGLSEATGARIAGERAARPFASLADFADRARPSSDELETLIRAGALDFAGRSRPALLLEARVAAGRGGAAGGARALVRAPALAANDGTPVLPTAVATVLTPELPEFSLEQRVRGELEALGLWFSAHPLDVMLPPGARDGTVRAAALPRHAGRRVAVVGMPCAQRGVETRSGDMMLFLTVADESGLVECALFPDTYRACAAATRGEIVRVEGRVDETLDSVTLGAERVEMLSASRDTPHGRQGRGQHHH